MRRLLIALAPASVLLVLTTQLAATLSQAAAATFDFARTPGRLPKNVVPIGYVLDLRPDAATGVIDGSETIRLRFTEATATVRLNSLNATLADVRLDNLPVTRVESDDTAQFTTITLPAAARPGLHTLTFRYRGKLERQAQGLFIQDYTRPDGTLGTLLSSKLEPSSARRVFPCWDEPAFRATFDLRITVPAHWSVVANMPALMREVRGTVATTRFQRTPRMPTYLFHVSAGELERITLQPNAKVGGTELGLWAVRGMAQYGRESLAHTAQVVADYNDYFGVAFPLPKLDSIAVPGGFSGAMENWGAITYTQTLLLHTAGSALAERQQGFSTMAHELAHQWHGDLVTMGWWDDIWLNESFASFMAAHEMEFRHPEWHWADRAHTTRETAMAADARPSALAIQQHVTSELQAANAFDTAITYNKGQSILRMFESWLGPEVFRDGLRALMKQHAYSNASTGDLWNALARSSGRDVAAVATTWTEQPGFPLLRVKATCAADGTRTAQVTQQRFLLTGTAPGALWAVPVQWRSGANGPAHALLLNGKSQDIAAGRCGEALSFNAGNRGYYRVSYDDATLAANSLAFKTLPDADRLALLDDQWTLVRTGAAPLAQYLALTQALGDTLHARAWQQIAGALEYLEFTVRGSAQHDALTAYARELLQPVLAALGHQPKPDELPDLQRLRATLLADLGEWGDSAIQAEARERFAAFEQNRASLAPDDQSAVFGLVAADADTATFERLHALARSSTDLPELRRLFAALMRVHDPALAQRSAAIAASAEIPPQAASLRPTLLATLAERHPELSWQRYQANYPAIYAANPPSAARNAARSVPEGYWHGVALADLESWVRTQLPPGMESYIASGLEYARFRLEERQRLTAAVGALLSAHSPGR